MRRLAEDSYIVLNIVPVNRTSAGAVNGAAVAKGDYDAVMAHCPTGAIGSATSGDFKLQDSDDDSTWTDIAGAAAVQLAATDDDKSPAIDAKLTKKYVRAVHTVTGTGGICAGVVLQLYRAKGLPVTNSPASVVV